MARKKIEESSGGNAPWLNTFADLMNLLLCFFVLLFAMSNIDAEKFEQISISLSNSFGIFDGGKTAIGEGDMISAGMAQLNNLDEYMNNMGESNKDTKDENFFEEGKTQDESGTSTDNNPDGNQGGKPDGGVADPKEDDEGKATEDDEDEAKLGIDEAIDKINKEKKQISETMYDSMSELSTQYNLEDYIELSIDPQFQFVRLSLKGSILFDSGKADIKDGAKPILSKIGDILQKYNEYIIEIEGHTDNVPMTSTTFKDNNWLSSARALTTAEYLINNKKLEPARIKYSGRGEYEPIASNATSEGRAKNRRIEIKVYNELSNR